jgi:hypothetical protein
MNVTWTAYPYGLEMAYPASNAENALQKVLATSAALLPLSLHCLARWLNAWLQSDLSHENIAMLQQERPGFMFVSELCYNEVLMTNFDPNVV